MAWGIGGRVCVCVCVCKNMNYQGGRGKKIHSYLLNVLAQDFIIGLRLCWIYVTREDLRKHIILRVHD